MSYSTAYNYRERSIFDLKTLIDALRFLIVNAILALILLFLSLEEIDWSIFSFVENLNDNVIDNTSWNIKNFFKFI